MSIQNRAKIFAPCATLKGYEKAIEAKQRIVVDKIELSEETKEFLDMQLNKINNLLLQKKHPIITVVYFQGDNKNIDEKGEYIQFTGMVAKLNVVSRIIQIVEKRIFFDDIYAITGEEIEL
ncbi:MAG: YolD-like family protein [Clostridiales bacterium]|nr:YolD-like family protein [Clostridiales bacterium]